jgi:hypothetical protein
VIHAVADTVGPDSSRNLQSIRRSNTRRTVSEFANQQRLVGVFEQQSRLVGAYHLDEFRQLDLASS